MIGLVTAKHGISRIQPAKWVDEGTVSRWHQDKDDWNAIGQSLVAENGGNAWLDWSSHWGGAKMRRIHAASGKLDATRTRMRTRCGRPGVPPIDGLVEAPSLALHGDHWCLFGSNDRCLRGANSTCNVVAGRSLEITDQTQKRGQAMNGRDGTLVIEATIATWRGPGHEAVLQGPGGGNLVHLVFRAYHGATGRPFRRGSTTSSDQGWRPRLGTCVPCAPRRDDIGAICSRSTGSGPWKAVEEVRETGDGRASD